MKKDVERFPRAQLRKAGGVLQTGDVVSIFHTEARDADTLAFSALMRHVKYFDEAHSTVIMVQVENEIGLLGDSRDGSSAATGGGVTAAVAPLAALSARAATLAL